MKTLFLITLVVFLVGSLTQAANVPVPEDLLQSVNEAKGKDKVELVSDEGFEDDLSEDDATDDDDVEDEEDEGYQEDEVAEDEEDFGSDEDPER